MNEMTGLSLFIADVRKCGCKDDETKRINKELANIRAKFNGDKALNGYMKKKYLCKLIYIYLLGHDSDIGILEAINLVASNECSEKYIGYLFLSLKMKENSNLSLLIHNSVKSDLTSSNPVHQNLALQYSANNANESLVADISADVFKILFSSDSPDNVKQSAILCILRIIRINPEAIVRDDYIKRIVSFISSSNLGMVTTVSSLLDVLAENGKLDGYPCVPNIVSKLCRFFTARPCDLKDYAYCEVQSPWMIVRLLRLLRKLPIPPNSVVKSRLIDCMELILVKCRESPTSKRLEHKNSKHAIMFEAILLIHHVKVEGPLILRVCDILEAELRRKDNNSRYLALEMICLLSDDQVVKEHFQPKLGFIKDFFCSEKDSSIQQKFSDLLYSLCDARNITEILNDLYCNVKTYDAIILKEDAILKIAYLVEQFHEDPAWYVDIILMLFESYGEYIKREIWFRFVEMVKKTNSIHGYACKRIFDTVKGGACCEFLVKVAGYILGEFGNLIAGDPNANSRAQLSCLDKYFHGSSFETKALLLTTYVKFMNLFPELKQEVLKIFGEYSKHADIEVQQRAVEYLKLSEYLNLEFILEVMPFKEESNSSVLKILQEIRPALYQMPVLEKRNTPVKPKSIFNSPLLPINGNMIGKTKKIKRIAPVKKISDRPAENESYVNILEDVFNGVEAFNDTLVSSKPNCDSQFLDSFLHYIWQNNIVVFENDILRVTCDCDFKRNLGRILLSYQSKSIALFQNFLPSFAFQNVPMNLKLYMQPCSPILCAGGEIKQEIHVECLREFSESPTLQVDFEFLGTHCGIVLKLPITLNKFFEEVSMDKCEFYSRWANLKEQELVKVFNYKFPMDGKTLVRKLISMKLSVLPNVSQDTADLFGAGIFHCSEYQVGVLYRLQSNECSKQYCLTVRATKQTVAEEIAKLVEALV